jgi:ACS family sodium-dependent inorganic phosphate cotransporter
VAYCERVGFSIAYTAMAKAAGVSEARKGSVLSAFYWGYGLSQARTAAYHMFPAANS